MDAFSVAKVLESGDLIAVAVVVIIAAVPLVKGLFALRMGRHQRRKEFIEFWRDADSRRSDLWLEEIVQHRYGAAPPARLIRHVISLARPSYKLKKVAMTASFFDLDEQNQKMAWVRPRRQRLSWFLAEVSVCWVGYLILAPVGVGLLIAGSRFRSQEEVVLTFLGVTLTGMACAVFWHLITLAEARSTITLVNGEARQGLRWALKASGQALRAVGGGREFMAHPTRRGRREE